MEIGDIISEYTKTTRNPNRGDIISMQILYYVEINMVCFLILLLLYLNRKNSMTNTYLDKLEKAIMIQTFIFCFADMGSWAFDGLNTPFFHFMLYASNITFFIVSCSIPFFWLVYTDRKIGTPALYLKPRVYVGFLIVFSLLVLSSPVTGLIFTVDAQGVYHRGPLIFTHWIISYGYMLGSIFVSVYRGSHMASNHGRSEAFKISLFSVFPLLCSAFQILWYGSTMIQVGFTLALIMYFTGQQNALISTDELTGTNNRAQMNRYLHERFSNPHTEEMIFLIMMDINNFKEINDTFGHLSGDAALKEMANLLKSVCGEFQRNLFLARYGGDEFVICGIRRNSMDEEIILSMVLEKLDEYNQDPTHPFPLSISAGSAYGSTANLTAQDLIRQADEAMYVQKKSYRKSNGGGDHS